MSVMKKIFASMAAVVLVQGARADASWLYWTFDLEDTWGNPGFAMARPTELEAGIYDVWLVAESDDDTVYFHDSENPETVNLGKGGQTGNIGGYSIADLSLLTGDLSDYVFYAALGTYDPESAEAEWTTKGRIYDSLVNFIQESEIEPSDVWNTAFVPEPTGGLLLLMGIAGLALRRKRVFV